MDRWLLAVTSDPAAKGPAEDLDVAGPVHCHFSLPPSFLTMCSSERCLSLASPWYIDHLNQHTHTHTHTRTVIHKAEKLNIFRHTK